MKYALIIALALLLCAPRMHAQERALSATDDPAMLSFDELVTLSSTANPEGILGARLNTLLTTPFVRNSAPGSDLGPHRPVVGEVGPVLRVALWNIERGLNFELIRSALTDSRGLQFENTDQVSDARAATVEEQLKILQGVDVLVLNEADLGMKRTEYRDVSADLASALHMNYAYAVEFIEVDPIFELGTEQVHLPDPQEDQRLQQDLQVDRGRYRGLHGTAILSRYPMRNVHIFRLPKCYDWYEEERKKVANIEKGKRWAADKLFKERIGREIRHGGRMALIADVSVPDLPTGAVTIVATHLENRCAPACRLRQMKALLAVIKDEQNPMVMAGDMNTTSKTNTPTSVRNEIMSRITDYQFWARQVVSYFHPLGAFKALLYPVHYFHGYNDPTAFHLPILWDNRERSLFKTLEKFRFDDKHVFDFRGDPERTLKQRGRTLSDSNQRAKKGFVPTYAFARDYGGFVGRFKLDWVFVKPFIEDPRRRGQSNLLAAYYARTLRELNESTAERISDHPPITVDLPLSESKTSRNP